MCSCAQVVWVRLTAAQQLYEQSRFANEVGAAVHLPPNANGILRRWGMRAETFGANPMERLVNMDELGAVLSDIPLVESNRRWQHPWHLVHRLNLHEHLKKIATGKDGTGTPARLHTSCRVAEADPERGILRLENGGAVSADVIIGADGIYVSARSPRHAGGRTGLMQKIVPNEKAHQGRGALRLGQGRIPVPDPEEGASDGPRHRPLSGPE